MFDPWTATFEQAWALQQETDELNGSDPWVSSSPTGPLGQFVGASRILAMREAIEGGDGFSVLGAIRVIVTSGLVAPEWLVYAYNRRYDSVLNCRAGSWDDEQAFGKPYPKGTNLAAQRKARTGRLAVWLEILKIRKMSPKTPIDKGLFEVVGKTLGFGATLTENYFYQAKRMNGWPLDGLKKTNPAKNRKSQGLRKKQR